jgi:uncharacterized protein YrrD
MSEPAAAHGRPASRKEIHMLRGKDVMKRPIIARDTGEKVGRVEDLVLDRSGSRVLGIVAAEKMLFGSEKVVPWTDVRSIGLDNVIVESKASVVKVSEAPEISAALEEEYVLLGNRLQTTGGRELGKIENFFFDPETGSVVGYEISGGINKGRESGSAFLPTPASFQAGKDYSFVDPSAVDTFEDLGDALRKRGSLARV